MTTMQSQQPGKAMPGKQLSYPFRIGTTSYIYPDDILPNVEKLRDTVDDIELLFFEAETESNLPTRRQIEELGRIAAESDLTYTVHLPLDVYLGDPDAATRLQSVDKALKVIRLTQSLEPFAFNLHFEKRTGDGKPVGDIARWQKNLQNSSEMIAAELKRPELIAVEYLNYPLELIESIVQTFGFSYVLDLGHMILDEIDFIDCLEQYIDRTRVIHLHGVAAGKDHVSLSKANVDKLSEILNFLQRRNYRNVLTLEIFSKSDFEGSLETLQKLWPQ